MYAGELSVIKSLLSGVMDSDELLCACRHGSRDDRLYAYRTLLLRVCGECFRYDGGIMYYHDGSCWLEMDESALRIAVQDVLVDGCKEFFPSVRSDVVRGSSFLFRSACDGVRMSPLGLDGSVVGFRNGVWDFRDIDAPVYHSFSERMPVLKLLDYDYDVDAGCPLWESFLRQVLDASGVERLQKFLGLGCVPRRRMSHKVEKMLWCVGVGGSGKSTIQKAVTGVYGMWNIGAAKMSELLSRSTDVRMRATMPIVGKLFNYCPEAQSNDITYHADTFKSLASGDVQNVREIGGKVHQAYDIPFMIFNMNSRPLNRKMDGAMLRRILQIDFPTVLRECDMDLELDYKLSREYSGIRNWMMEGYRKLVRDDFKFGDEDRMLSVDQLVENGQTVLAFFLDRGIRFERHIDFSGERPQQVGAEYLYQDYCQWCPLHDVIPESRSSFGRTVSAMPNSKKRRVARGMVYYLYSDKPLPYAGR